MPDTSSGNNWEFSGREKATVVILLWRGKKCSQQQQQQKHI